MTAPIAATFTPGQHVWYSGSWPEYHGPAVVVRTEPNGRVTVLVSLRFGFGVFPPRTLCVRSTSVEDYPLGGRPLDEADLAAMVAEAGAQ